MLKEAARRLFQKPVEESKHHVGAYGGKKSDRKDIHLSANGQGERRRPNMRTSICRITEMGWRPVAAWASGLTGTTSRVHTRHWVMRRRLKCTWLPGLTAPSQPLWKRCNRKAPIAVEKLEVRPPMVVRIETPLNGKGRAGSAQRGSFSLFQMVLKRRVDNRQTKTTVTADRENQSYFLRSVV